MHKILILGIDGYLGWSFALYLGGYDQYEISGIDNYLRRDMVAEIGSQSAIPIPRMTERLDAYRSHFHKNIHFMRGSLTDYNFLYNAIKSIGPDTIIHLAEQPSAPYSMIDIHHTIQTHTNNLLGTLNLLYAIRDINTDIHLIKLGTLGEYGTPGIDIPEGFITVQYKGRQAHLPFPKSPGSFYHLTKVHDTHNIMFASKIWNIRATDIMQGVVYGVQDVVVPRVITLETRFDFDHCFGTVINRFLAQSIIGHSLTVYGKGAQKRGFLPQTDSMKCLKISVDNPPLPGEYRVFNQFDRTYSILELATAIQEISKEYFGITTNIEHLDNPRVEEEEHYYNPENNKLKELGYKPSETNLHDQIITMFSVLLTYKDRILAREHAILPNIRWRR